MTIGYWLFPARVCDSASTPSLHPVERGQGREAAMTPIIIVLLSLSHPMGEGRGEGPNFPFLLSAFQFSFHVLKYTDGSRELHNLPSPGD